ncbi:MAG TPA: MFS transporter [Steroidobacteraceae bacterium]|nr:MFS transporter [Steroidobacteraceae bacterium]
MNKSYVSLTREGPAVAEGEPAGEAAANPVGRVLIASLAGTTIEFFDFYIYATAAVLVFPGLFFPASDKASAALQSLATFALAFLARPVGSAVFGHFGDRIGRKATLVAALLTMGVSTVGIGVLPGYARIGIWAPAALALLRFGQGFGLGGEWGGAVLLATENAPPGKAALYGMFPQLGAPLGFLCSTGAFLVLAYTLDDRQLFGWGWRLPFVASALLVLVGLYVRLTLTETPEFRRVLRNHERIRVPLLRVLTRHWQPVVLGTFAATATFVIFYLMTVFTLSWGTQELGFTRPVFLVLQMIGVLAFAAVIPLSALLAHRRGTTTVLIIASAAIALFGLTTGPWFGSGTIAGTVAYLCLGLALMGLTYGPLGTALAALFPAEVRYTGASLTFNLAGIVGGSFAPYAAKWLATAHGLSWVGDYLSAAGAVSLIAALLIRRQSRLAVG